MVQFCLSANGAQDTNGLGGRQAMESKIKLNRKGWIVCVIIPGLIAMMIFSYVTRDVCYVGNMPGNHLGYGSCSKMIDTVTEKGK
jgi:predicted nucleic acid-binding Zn finger protein